MAVTGRACACGCHASIEHLRPDARFLNATCRKRGLRAARRGPEATPEDLAHVRAWIVRNPVAEVLDDLGVPSRAIVAAAEVGRVALLRAEIAQAEVDALEAAMARPLVTVDPVVPGPPVPCGTSEGSS